MARWPAGALERFVRAGLLAEADPAASAACDACGFDHVEPVQWYREPGLPARACVACPWRGVVWLNPDALRRWAVRLPALAQLAATAVGAAGGVSGRVPGRAWKLGTVRVGGRAWVATLAVGLTRPDAAAVVEAVSELRAANALVFVPSTPPAPSIWPAGRAPAVVPLCDVLTFDSTGLSLDRDALAAALTPAARTAAKAPARVFPTPPGTTWEEVALSVDEHHITVRVGATAERFGFAEAGFEDRREGGKPDDVWALLRTLGRCRGRLGTGDAVATKPGKLKAKVSALRDRLRGLLALEGDPFHPTRKRQHYRARFAIRAEGAATFPAPPGATWDDITLTEVEAGIVEVAVTAAARGAEYIPADEEGAGRWEGTTTAEERSARYTLADLGLADPDGVAPAGAALVTVLRAGGRLTRPADDPDLLALGGALTRFFRLSDPPFTFDARRRTWAAKFEAASFVPASDR